MHAVEILGVEGCMQVRNLSSQSTRSKKFGSDLLHKVILLHNRKLFSIFVEVWSGNRIESIIGPTDGLRKLYCQIISDLKRTQTKIVRKKALLTCYTM